MRWMAPSARATRQLETWRKAYEQLIERADCGSGPMATRVDDKWQIAITLEHLADMVKKGVDFVVYDAKTNEDITRTVLTQIIFREIYKCFNS